LIERGFHAGLDRRCQRIGVGRKDRLQDSRTEVRAVHALARIGKEHLLDKIAHILRILRAPRSPARINAKRVVNMCHIPVTLGCTVETIAGPCGICSTL
jgi:hypothetical protein